VALEHGLVPALSPSPRRRWWREDQSTPWRSHAWQQSTDPHVVENAAPVLALDEPAPARVPQAEASCGVEEQTARQARPRVSATHAAVPDAAVPVAER
jgi:hypothetical protein